MADLLNQIHSLTFSTKQTNNPKKLINFDKSMNSNKNNRRIESANTNFTINTYNNFNQKNKNFNNQSISSENYSGTINYTTPKQKYYKPTWKYSYYLDKNQILSLNNINNNPEIRNTLCDYKDIDKRPKPIVYSWTKPRMVKILENNANIEEEVKTHFWKYSHIFENNAMKRPGKLLNILIFLDLLSIFLLKDYILFEVLDFFYYKL